VSGRPVRVHSSLRSFGHIEGGAETLLGAFLDEGATLLVPSFSWQYAAPAPLGHRPDRNGTEYDYASRLLPEIGFSPRSTAVDRDMGALAAAVVRHPGRERGNHPICSFTALGPMATTLLPARGALALLTATIQDGLMAATLDRADNGSLLRKAGIMSIVVRGGTVRAGDSIVADLPPVPHHPLDRV
jgi:hypothetical protein